MSIYLLLDKKPTNFQVFHIYPEPRFFRPRDNS